jgi:hypothetical protein
MGGGRRDADEREEVEELMQWRGHGVEVVLERKVFLGEEMGKVVARWLCSPRPQVNGCGKSEVVKGGEPRGGGL